MGWDVFKDTTPVARKDYSCDAFRYWLTNIGEDEFDADDLLVYQAAKADGFRIKKGMKYVKREGKFDGEWCVFRAREDLNNLCIKLDLYNDY